MIQFADTDPFKFLEQLQELFPLHYEELCVTKDYPLSPNYEQYKRLAECGMLKCVIVTHDEKVIGYVLFLVHKHLHYSTCMTAFEDIYWLHPEYRKGRIGIRMFQYAEKMLKAFGVNRIVMHTKVHQDHSRLFEYLGYKWTDKLFTKLI